jgi:calcium binding protein 39
MMIMLKDKSRNIQFEAFHVFKVKLLSSFSNTMINITFLIKFKKKKVFVANPNKPKPITDILLRNKEKLNEFLSGFHSDRNDDEQFNDEKAYLIKQIKELKET